VLRVSDCSRRVEEVGVGTASHVAGRTVAELDVRKRADCLLMAIKRPDTGEYV
jgi:Trk K+ transport system NAD-binding subunit